MSQITKEMTIESIFSQFPHKSQKLAQTMLNQGLHCVGCGAATWETLESGMLSHGFEIEEIDAFVDELNAILQETSDASTITLTPKAATKFLSILKDEGKEGWALRFGYKKGGCSGSEYVLDYSKQASATDQAFHSNGVDIHVAKEMLDTLLGCEIDYIDGLNGSGFRISNPQAKGSCGCGKSQRF